MIASKEYVMQKLNEYGIFPSKKYGQNFLIQQEVVKKAVATLEITPQDIVLEVGPGLGALSEELVEQKVETHLYDIDKNMVQHLSKTFMMFPQIHVHEGDFLKVQEPRATKIIGNLPYYITTPLIEHILLDFPNLQIFTFMVQEEVEERLFAKIGSKEYGPFSLLIEATCETKKVCKVHRTSFYPVPHVDSAIYCFKKKEGISLSFYKFLKAMFTMRRKTILNNLLSYISSKEQAILCLKEAGIDEKRRPESISLKEYQNLYQAITK